MQVDYQNLADQAKVFLYPSSRKFYPQEMDHLHEKISSFLDENFLDFNVYFKIVYQRFIVFFIDTNQVLPITLLDKLASFILDLEKEYDIILLDKINICFKQGDYVQYQDMKKFRTLLKNKSVSKNTIIFNNMIQNKFDYENHFETPLSESWLAHLVK